MRVREKKNIKPIERRLKYLFSVWELKTDEKVGEYSCFEDIPNGYCNEKKYRITYRKEFA